LIEKNICHLFSDELDSGHYDALFSIEKEEEERLDVFNEICSSE
jgi:hypothetical protein